MKPFCTLGLLALVGAYAWLGGSPAELLFLVPGALVAGVLLDLQAA